MQNAAPHIIHSFIMRLERCAKTKHLAILGSLFVVVALCAPPSLAGELPSMVNFTDSKNTVGLRIPADWDISVDSVFRNAQVSNGDSSKMVVSWNDAEEDTNPKALLDGVLRHLRESISGVPLTEIRQRSFSSGNGRTALASYDAFDATIFLAAVVVHLPEQDRVLSGVLFATQDDFEAIDGLKLLKTVLLSIKVTAPPTASISPTDAPSQS